jgi:hypothetical protein
VAEQKNQFLLSSSGYPEDYSSIVPYRKPVLNYKVYGMNQLFLLVFKAFVVMTK